MCTLVAEVLVLAQTGGPDQPGVDLLGARGGALEREEKTETTPGKMNR